MRKNTEKEDGVTIAQEAEKAWTDLLQFVRNNGFLPQVAEDIAPRTKGLYLLQQDNFDIVLREDGKLVSVNTETRMVGNEVDAVALAKRHKPAVCMQALEMAFKRRRDKEKQKYEDAAQAIEIGRRLMA